MFQLKDRVAVVTGGNGGIGLGMARGLAGAGARVVVAARQVDKSAAAVAELQAIGPAAMALALAVDVTDEASVRALVDETVARCGRLDILVNNAGINTRKPPHELTLDEWRRVIDTNLTGGFLCARAAYPEMKRGGGGKIINIGSLFSTFGGPLAAAYSASKGGVVQLTKSLAAAWAPDNIQVNAVLPGFIESDLTREARRQIPGLHERTLARTPAARWGTADDLAGIAVFLASAASDFITGAVIPVDGGYSIMF